MLTKIFVTLVTIAIAV